MDVSPGQQWLPPYAWVQDTKPAVEAGRERFRGHPGTTTTGPVPVAFQCAPLRPCRSLLPGVWPPRHPLVLGSCGYRYWMPVVAQSIHETILVAMK